MLDAGQKMLNERLFDVGIQISGVLERSLGLWNFLMDTDFAN